MVYAVAGTTVQFPRTVPLADEHLPLLTEPWDFFLFDDLLQDAVESLLGRDAVALSV